MWSFYTKGLVNCQVKLIMTHCLIFPFFSQIIITTLLLLCVMMYVRTGGISTRQIVCLVMLVGFYIQQDMTHVVNTFNCVCLFVCD